MSHDGIWRAACLHRSWIRVLHLEVPSAARGVTDVGVGSGALLGFGITRLRPGHNIHDVVRTKSKLRFICDRYAVDLNDFNSPRDGNFRYLAAIFKD